MPKPKKTNMLAKKRSTAATSKMSDARGRRNWFTRLWSDVGTRSKDLLARRPHRSFKKTLRRDYSRPLRLPGYWAFTNYVRRILFANKKIFVYLIVIYAVLSIVLIGLASQETYTEISDTLRDASEEIVDGNLGELGNATLLLGTAVTGSLNGTPTDLQRLYAIILALLVWLTTVWLLRAIVAGNKPKLRDGLYNAGAPFLSTLLVSLVIIVQLLPIALAIIGYGAAVSSGLLDGGIEAMVFWAAAGLLGTLSIYWLSGTFIALVVVTLPGMYPMQAIKTAGDLVIGRRMRILLRLLWLLFIVALFWVVIMVPIILLDTWIKGIWPVIHWVPVVPIALIVMSSLTIVWSSSYTYLLYRKVVDDDAAPA